MGEFCTADTSDTSWHVSLTDKYWWISRITHTILQLWSIVLDEKTKNRMYIAELFATYAIFLISRKALKMR